MAQSGLPDAGASSTKAIERNTAEQTMQPSFPGTTLYRLSTGSGYQDEQEEDACAKRGNGDNQKRNKQLVHLTPPK